MSEPMSKARQIAEVAFGKTQTQFIERSRAYREQDAEIAERNEKTLRLRAARIERDQSEKALPRSASRKK